ncbi:MAG: hypothetical protein ACUVYA_08430 [Planctomycetota bacterium]
MSTEKIRVRGWQAAIVALAALGFLAYRWVTVKTTLASEATVELRVWLRADYTRLLLGELAPGALLNAPNDPRVQALIDLEKIEFPSIESRGVDPVYVRAEIRVAGKDPPDGRRVRYWQMERSAVTGWRVRREISPLRYWLRFF